MRWSVQLAQAVRDWRDLCLRSPIKRFPSDERGVTAIEFGIIALPFFAIIMAIVEAGLAFFAGQVMDTGFREAARRLRTGQAQGMSQTQMRDAMCSLINQSSGLFNCSDLYVDLRVMSFDSGALASEPTTGGDFDSSKISYNTSVCGSQTVLMRAYYEWPSFANLLGSSLTRAPNGKILLSSTAAFRTEPFGGCS